MSSRNRYLFPEERVRALILQRVLGEAERLVKHGETSAQTLQAAMVATFSPDPMPISMLDRLDYAAIVHADTLEPLADTSGGALIAVAAWIGKTRLIDNLVIQPLARG